MNKDISGGIQEQFPSLPTAGLRQAPQQKNVDDSELQSAPCFCFPDPRGFLREPQFPEGAPRFLRDIHGPKIAWLRIFYGSHGDFSSVLLHVFPQEE